MIRTAYIILISVIQCSMPMWLKAQPMLFEHITSREGLSQNSGYDCVRMFDYLWFATQDGLNRYDGTSITQYKSDKHPNLSANYIFKLMDAGDTYLWVATSNGISILDPVNNQFFKFEDIYCTDHPLIKKCIDLMYMGFDQKVFLGSYEAGMVVFDLKTNTVKEIPFLSDKKVYDVEYTQNYGSLFATDHGLYAMKDLGIGEMIMFFEHFKDTTGIIRSLNTDKDGNLWMGSFTTGIYVLDTLLSVRHYSTESGLIGNEIKDMTLDYLGRSWIGTSQGLSIFDPEIQKWTNYESTENFKTLGKNYILRIYEDVQHIIWLGLSGGGFDKYDPGRMMFNEIKIKQTAQKGFIADNMIFEIFGFQDQIFFSSQNAGIYSLDKKSNLLSNYNTHNSDLLDNQVYEMQNDSKGNLWLCTAKGLSVFNPGTKKFGEPVRNEKLEHLFTLEVMGDDEIWVGGQKGLYVFNPQTRKESPFYKDEQFKTLSTHLIRIIERDSFDQVWIGTTGNGLFVYNRSTNTLKQMTDHDFERRNIRCFLPDGKNMFVGTDDGYFLVDENLKVIQSITIRNGLPNNVVYAIQKSKDGGLWISTNKGISHVSGDSRNIKNFSYSDGLQSDEFNTSCSWRDNDTLYFGGVAGINYFEDNEPQTLGYNTRFRVTELKINGEVYDGPLIMNQNHQIKLKANHNFLEFTCSSSNYSRAIDNRFMYQLNNVNEQFILSNSNKIGYTNLIPGEYSFNLIKVSPNGDKVETPSKLGIIIQPNYWQTWWFKAGIITLLAISIIVFIYSKLRTVRKQYEVQRKYDLWKANVELKALQSQMNPHFIFNSLNSIHRYILKSDKENASEYLVKFSKLIRKVLDHSRKNAIPLSEELESIRLYLDLESLRFQDGFEYEIIVDNDINPNSTIIPPMIIQPFVENAIWHGLLGSSSSNKLTIQIFSQQDALVCSVIDNGIGRAASKLKKNGKKNGKQSYGIEIAKERLVLLGQEKSHIQIEDLYHIDGQAAGTKVDIVMNLKKSIT